MDFSSFLTSLGTSFLIFLVLIIIFTCLSRRPGNHVVYYPNRILKGLDPYDGDTRNPFAWIREALSSTEADVIRMSGVDTAVYFVFLSTALGILVLSGLVLLPVLLPVAATAHSVMKANDTTSNGAFDDLDKLSIGHIEGGSPRLWAFLIATYWVTFVTFYLLWKAYKHVSDLRADALMSSDANNEQFAVLVRDIPHLPEGQTRKEQVDSYFRTIYPDTFHRSLVVTDNKQVNKIYKELEGYKKKLARSEAIHTQSKGTASPEGTRPTTKTGLLCLGKKVDAIEYYDEKIKELSVKLESEQKVTIKDKQQSAAIIFFKDRVTAAAASQSLHDAMVDKWTVVAAPEPRQLLWTNLSKKFYEREIRQYLIYFIVFLTIFFYVIPIGLVSALTTLANLKKILPFLKPVIDQPTIKTVLEAFLPQLALLVFLALLPTFLLFLSKAEGIASESHAQRAASGKYFYFAVLNVFIGVTLASTIFTTIKDIQEKPSSTPEVLAKSLPGSATFFLTFVALRFFVGYGLELSRLIPLIIYHIKKKYLCKTEAEVKEAWTPGNLGYATRFPNDMLILTIVICYSIIAPIIIPFGVVYFGLGWLVLRNQALKVYVPSYESYGRMWPHIYNRIIAALILFQVTMLGYFPAKQFYYAPLLIPLPILSLIFAFICTKKYYRFFESTALDVACRELKETPNLEAVFRSYIPPSLSSEIPPSLSSEKADENQLEDALSQVSRPASVV